jgi:hypothetical protein
MAFPKLAAKDYNFSSGTLLGVANRILTDCPAASSIMEKELTDRAERIHLRILQLRDSL